MNFDYNLFNKLKNEKKNGEIFHYVNECYVSGSIDASYELAQIYYKGLEGIVLINYEYAFKYFLEAANKNHFKAQNMVGIFYEYGYYVQKDLKKAYEYYLLSSNQNHAVAHYNVGLCYEYNKGVTKDMSKAAYYYELATNNGYLKAANKIARCYEEGIGVNKDLPKAMTYYRKSYDFIHDGESSYKLGKYEYDLKNYQSAYFYFNTGVIKKHPKATYYLGKCYELGYHVSVDFKKAIEYYLIATDLGDDEAPGSLGFMYETGAIFKDINKAVHYYTISSNRNNRVAMYNLGLCYEFGKGVEKNEFTAFNYYQKSANLGFAKAYYRLGVCYEHRIGVLVNDSYAAAENYMKAYKLRDKEAEKRLRDL